MLHNYFKNSAYLDLIDLVIDAYATVRDDSLDDTVVAEFARFGTDLNR